MTTFAKAAVVRALRTVGQAAVALVPVTAVALHEVDWLLVASGGALAGALSLLTSLAGLPEVE